MHYARKERGADMDKPPQLHQGGRLCSADDCFRPHYAKGYCEAHYARKLRSKPIDEPLNEYTRDIGAIRLRDDGYVWEKVIKNGTATWMPQHHKRMEEMLGRPLREGEMVHHKNGIRNDNRADNLELWTRAHPYGVRQQDLADWIKQWIAENGKEYGIELQQSE